MLYLKNKNLLKLLCDQHNFIDTLNSTKIVKILENTKFNIFNAIQVINNLYLNYYDIVNKTKLNSNDYKLINFYQKEISLHMHYVYIYKLLKDYKSGDNIFFSYYFDFRGRLYYDSPVSVTSSKIARFLYHHGDMKIFIKTMIQNFAMILQKA